MNLDLWGYGFGTRTIIFGNDQFGFAGTESWEGYGGNGKE